MLIPNFPHANFYPATRSGYLFYYYPYNAVKEKTLDYNSWEMQSYSPQLLSFKRGSDNSIEFFVKPFIELIKNSLKTLNKESEEAFLIPVPSSKSKDDPKYNDKFIENNQINRDNRNNIFCQKIERNISKFIYCDAINRVVSKEPKDHRTAIEHSKTLELDMLNISSKHINQSSILILVDDLKRDGSTLGGCKHRLHELFPNNDILELTLGISKAPREFKPLSNNF